MLASAVSGSVAGAANKTMLSVFGSADRRAKIKRISISSDDASLTDVKAVFALRRATAAGAGGSAVTPMIADPGDGTTASCTSKANYTANEPTYASGNLKEWAIHDKGQYEFRPDEGETWAMAIGTANGLGVVQLSSGTETYRVEIDWEE